MQTLAYVFILCLSFYLGWDFFEDDRPLFASTPDVVSVIYALLRHGRLRCRSRGDVEHRSGLPAADGDEVRRVQFEATIRLRIVDWLELARPRHPCSVSVMLV